MDNSEIREQIEELREYKEWGFHGKAAKTLELLLAIKVAAEDSNKYLLKELSKYDGWQQFEFLPESYDLYWYYQQEKALKAFEDA